MTKPEFNAMNAGQKENLLRGSALEIATINLHTRIVWKQFTLHKVGNIFFEVENAGTFDSKGYKVSEDPEFNPIAFALTEKPMEAWMHFMNLDIRLLRAMMK